MSIKCLYCQEVKPISCYSKSEHVLSQSFGRFNQNLTLNKIVCDDCNQYFGDNLELALARDSFEGKQRFKFNVKQPSEHKSFGLDSRLTIRVAEGQFKGVFAYQDYSSTDDRIVIKPCSQVGFKKKDSGEYEYYLIDNLPDKDTLNSDNFDFDHPNSIRALGVEEDLLITRLNKIGISMRIHGEEYSAEEDDDLLCEVQGEIDSIIYRAIAKIGFNYLTYCEDRDFTNQTDFDVIRNYIRYGVESAYPLVNVSEKPILGDEPVSGERRQGHLITVNFDPIKELIVSQVSLFNWATYSIGLACGFTGQKNDIKSGHFFNINSNEILELETR